MTPSKEDRPLVFRNTWSTFVHDWRTIVLCILSLTLLAGAYALIAEPVFEAEVTMIAMDEDDAASASMPSGLASIAAGAGVSLESNNYLRVVSLATLQSRSFIRSFIENSGLLPVLYADDWDADSGEWSDEAPTINDACERFSDDILSVSQDFQTGLTTLGIRWRDPHQAADWANTLVEAVNHEVRQRAIAEASESIAYLQMERESTSVIGVQQAIDDLIETQLNRQMQANVRGEYAFRVIDPATAPDDDDPVFPKLLLLLCAGSLIGLMLGIAIVIVRDVTATGGELQAA